MNYAIKITNLWMLLILGLLIHSFMFVFPLFIDHSIAIADAGEQYLFALTWMFLLCMLLPMLLILLLQIFQGHSFRKIHFAISLPYLLLSAAHPFENIGLNPLPWDQVILQVFILSVSITISVLGFKWMKLDR